MKKYALLVLAVMLISIFTLALFFQITHAGTPDVGTQASVSINNSNKAKASAKTTCDIGGTLVEGESYTGHGYVSIWFDSWNISQSDELWARVIRKHFLWWSWLSVDARDPLKVKDSRYMDPGDVVTASAYGYLGNASSNAYDYAIVD
jgi:hypothetical protein